MSELQLQSTSLSNWREFRYEVVIECVPTVCNEMDCVTVLEKTATKFYVEGILGRVSFRNESNGFASVVYYGLVAMAKAVDISYIKSIIPLVGATFTPTDELSFNEKSAVIMMFSFEHKDYYEFGHFNFNSCAVRSKVLSRVAKRPASAINLNYTALDSSAGILPESDSECERKDQSCVLPRTPVQPSYVPARTMTRNLLPISCQNQYLKRVRQAELKLCCSRYHSDGRCYRATMETIFNRNNLIYAIAG